MIQSIRSAGLLLVALTILHTISAQAASTDPENRQPLGTEVDGTLALLDRWLDAYHAYHDIPGMSVGIVLDQSLIWQRGYGFANPARKLAANAETLYSICSISKLFTGIAVVQQRDAGALQLDDPVELHLDWFTLTRSHPGSGPITVRSLLTHASGLPRESINAYWSPPDYRFPSREVLVDALSLQETLYPAERYFQYSNLGIALAGEIVSARSEMRYEDYVRTRILEPLAMRQTRTELPRNLHGTALAIGHGARNRDGERPVQPRFETGALTAAAGFSSNIVDLARFAAWHFSTLAGTDNPVLAPASLREMQRVQWLDPDWQTSWGLAYEIRRVAGQTVIGHDGLCPGYSTSFLLLPAHRLAVIVLMNAGGVDPAAVADNIHRLLVPALQAPQVEPASLPRFGPFTGLYDAQPWQGEVAVIQHGEELRLIWLPSDNATEGVVRLRQVEGDTFRRIRDDSDLPGEPWYFVRDAADNVVALATHALRLQKLR